MSSDKIRIKDWIQPRHPSKMPSQAATKIMICVSHILLSIDTIVNVCGPSRLKGPEDEGLPEAFPVVLEHLSTTASVFCAIKRRLSDRNCDKDSREQKESYPSVQQLVDDCRTKATKMATIYEAVVPGDAKGRETRYRQKTSVDETVEALMKDMLASMLQVAESPLGLIKEKEQNELKAALDLVAKLPPSLTEEEQFGYVYHINNNGSGLQPVHSGRGHQHIYGHNMGGTFHGATHVYSAKLHQED
ncbi:hypothetical protein M406DRAFT_356157 [Cryphonectria parasitica EP155]|uniref:NACHT-NTPase and P-loop NTPases N-terminal domain-containing protein n=1 Tax=Cryphonectria parasitica (strain ATCC 38755 / EP155) TaxID=660469 RepID=A0A9P4Y3T0_CRYP1|nr:uncharacterized protein M406DRAFT_356157 [Cryphonectria parasitica EP155]KAF3765989.1 hypothetical protein M406DRAFT_356157 [Cryphonectria parasitica EP155]